MTGLDPVLAAVRRNPWGDPRFYPYGQHPATHRLRQHLAALEELRERLDGLPYAPDETEAALLERLTVCDASIAYVREQLARFERSESIAKANHLRMVERGAGCPIDP